MQRGNWNMVAREGSAPSISGCRPDVMLFHYQAYDLAASLGFAPTRAPSKGAVLLLDDPAMIWWPARVTLPIQRIKSPLHHFNACRPEWCSRQDLHLHCRRSRRRASALGYASNGWSLSLELHRQDLFTKKIRRLLQRGRDGRSPRCCPGRGWLMTPA